VKKIPGSDKVINIVKPVIKPVSKALVIPFKIKITHKPIEKFLWPNNELTIERISMIKEKDAKNISTYIFNCNLCIGDGKTPTYFIANGIGILKDDHKISVKPKAYFLIKNNGVIVYEDRLIVKGSNHIENWNEPYADAFLLILPKKNIPKERYYKIAQLYKKLNQFTILLKKYKEYVDVEDKNKIIITEGKIIRLKEEILRLAEELGVSRYIQEIIELKTQTILSH